MTAPSSSTCVSLTSPPRTNNPAPSSTVRHAGKHGQGAHHVGLRAGGAYDIERSKPEPCVWRRADDRRANRDLIGQTGDFQRDADGIGGPVRLRARRSSIGSRATPTSRHRRRADGLTVNWPGSSVTASQPCL